ncbi:DsbA family oxidoreductase [Persicimonas caeni]|uniref:DsbA family oxidoreductase n=1 Tax=Persicimonas caeni TaxID=2292766 RepID=A0A4Y6PVI6_PERCE|nr:DsbA family oxidoreductase [Persicimonas caeni]QDG52250.1 DsbA family oxidoreductase [Persicimonas caeni]QED33472.1 DsbA family oxidoreductase [Persicimonas caeni]
MKIEIWSDVVCPWCYIGKRRLEAALEEFDEEVDITWRSFQLDPSAPDKPSGPLVEELAKKYGVGVEQARAMMQRVEQNAADEGLDFDFDNAQGGNTFDAHRVIHFASEHGPDGQNKQGEMKERLLSAYMTEGRPISDRDELAKLAGEVGLDAKEVREMLDGDRFVDAVKYDRAEARQIGVTGVPFFLIEGKYGIPGAQASETLLSALETVREKERAIDAPQGDACDDEGCDLPGQS